MGWAGEVATLVEDVDGNGQTTGFVLVTGWDATPEVAVRAPFWHGQPTDGLPRHSVAFGASPPGAWIVDSSGYVYRLLLP